jgi:nickel-type superoxide dismutase maturation protease
MEILSILKITGDSLAPFLQHGDYVVAGRAGWMLRSIKPGDVIVFDHPHYGRMVKRLQAIGPGGLDLFVTGSSPESVDSRRFGPIPRSSVTAKALVFIRKGGRMNTEHVQ